jgi:hypothetical protein
MGQVLRHLAGDKVKRGPDSQGRIVKRTPPVLDLGPDCIMKPNIVHLAEIKAVMLWPNNEAARHISMQVAVLQLGRDLMHKGNFPVSEIASWADAAFEALPRAAKVMEAEGHRFKLGLRAGQILLEAVFRGRTESVAIFPIIEEVTRQYTGRDATNSKAINNEVWTPFRPVAHFWAAFLLTWNRNDDRAFPCRRDNLLTFLGAVDKLRQLGEQNPHVARGRPVLRAGESVLVPDCIVLPEIEIFPPMP